MKSLTAHLPINQTSYGIVSRNILLELDRTGFDVSLFPIGPVECEQNEIEVVEKCLERAKTFPTDVPHLRLFHQFSLAERVGRGPLWGFPIWETDNFTDWECHHIEQCDGLLVASEWARNIVLEKTQQKNVHVCPLGANPNIFKKIPFTKNKEFTILYCGKIELRKLVDIVPEIFSRAFTKNDRVNLKVSFYNLFLSESDHQEWYDFYKSSPLGDKIEFLPRIPISELNKLYNSVDCLLAISRAEGACLPAIEMLQIGKPIIFVDYGGITQYLNKNNACPITVDKLVPAMDAKWFIPGADTNQGNWADFGESQIEQCVVHLQNLYKKWQEGKIYRPITTEFTWKNSVKKLIEVIFSG